MKCPEGYITLIHDSPDCGKVAFYSKKDTWEKFITSAGALMAEDVLSVDGDEIIEGSQVSCTSCGKPMETQPTVGDKE